MLRLAAMAAVGIVTLMTIGIRTKRKAQAKAAPKPKKK